MDQRVVSAPPPPPPGPPPGREAAVSTHPPSGAPPHSRARYEDRGHRSSRPPPRHFDDRGGGRRVDAAAPWAQPWHGMRRGRNGDEGAYAGGQRGPGRAPPPPHQHAQAGVPRLPLRATPREASAEEAAKAWADFVDESVAAGLEIRGVVDPVAVMNAAGVDADEYRFPGFDRGAKGELVVSISTWNRYWEAFTAVVEEAHEAAVRATLRREQSCSSGGTGGSAPGVLPGRRVICTMREWPSNAAEHQVVVASVLELAACFGVVEHIALRSPDIALQFTTVRAAQSFLAFVLADGGLPSLRHGFRAALQAARAAPSLPCDIFANAVEAEVPAEGGDPTPTATSTSAELEQGPGEAPGTAGSTDSPQSAKIAAEDGGNSSKEQGGAALLLGPALELPTAHLTALFVTLYGALDVTYLRTGHFRLAFRNVVDARFALHVLSQSLRKAFGLTLAFPVNQGVLHPALSSQ